MTVPKKSATPASEVIIPLAIDTKGVKIDKTTRKRLVEKIKINDEMASEVYKFTKSYTPGLKEWKHGNAKTFENLVMTIGTDIEENKIASKMTDKEYDDFVKKREDKMTTLKWYIMMGKRYYTGRKVIKIIEGQPHKVRRVVEVTKGKKGKERVVNQSQNKIVFCRDGERWDPVSKRCYVYAEGRNSVKESKDKKKTE